MAGTGGKDVTALSSMRCELAAEDGHDKDLIYPEGLEGIFVLDLDPEYEE